MADRKYAVTFGGELIEGMTPVRLRERLSRLPEPLAASQIDALLGARNVTLRLFADRETANHFVNELREAGMVCWLRLLHPGEEVQALLDAPAATPAEAVERIAEPVAARAGPVDGRPALGTGALTALVVLGIGGAVAAWYAWPQPTRHHRSTSDAVAAPAASEPVAATSAAPAPATESAADRPETADNRPTTSLLVPEPPLTVSVKRDKPKTEAAPAPTETAKREDPKTQPPPAQQVKTSLQPGSGVATFAPVQAAAAAPASAPPPVATESRPAQLAMITPKVTAPAADVIVPPTYDRNRVAQPHYPVQSFRNGEQGEVVLGVLVGADGKPKRVTIDKTSGFTLLDRAAVDAVKTWQFAPGTRNGVPQEAARQVAVGFKLGDQ